MSPSHKPRTLMVGIDAGDLAFINGNIDRLPTLSRILSSNSVQRLRTTSEHLTGSVWPTFYTGTDPGTHGIYHHLQWDPAQMRLRRVTEDWLYEEPFWYELARMGKRVTVLDVPMTFPSRMPDGIEVVSWGAHDQLCQLNGNDRQVIADIKRQFGSHDMGPEIPVSKSHRELTKIRKNLLNGVRRKGEVIRYLMKSSQWDLFLTVFGETHRGGHILWPEEDDDSVVPHDALFDVYQAVDTELGAILESIDLNNTTFILFSVHGMERNYSQEHFVPEILQRLNQEFVSNSQGASPAKTEKANIIRYLRKNVPSSVQNFVAKSVPVGVRDWVVTREKSSGFKWENVPSIALLADYNGYIKLNLQARERDGCLADPKVIENYKTALAECFGSFRMTIGNSEKLVKEVVEAANLYDGRKVSMLPDLIVTWNRQPASTIVESATFGRVTANRDTGRTGNHRHEGFLVALTANGGGEAKDWAGITEISDIANSIKAQLA